MHRLRSSFAPIALSLLICCLVVACGGSSSRRAAAGTGGAGFGGPIFAGVGSANAISPTSVVVSWPDAVNSQGGGAASMVYRVYRGLSAALALSEAALVHVTQPGVTSFIDAGLGDFTTYFYRVVAVDTSGQRSRTNALTNARTPSPYSGGNADYHADIEPLWSTASASGQRCIDCHDGTAAGGRLNLTTWEGVLAGVGTLAAPNSFVIPYDGEGTWSEFVERFVSNPLPHSQYFGMAAVIATWEDLLSDWVEEGALEFPDAEPPIFEFDSIENAGKYFGRFLDFQTAEVTWFHANDPESLPPSGSTLDQLEYYVYAGVDSDSIDWDTPVAGPILSTVKSSTSTTMTTSFPWFEDRAAVVVRAVDASGRSTVLPPIGDPGYLDALKKRYRNMAVNEREIRLAR